MDRELLLSKTSSFVAQLHPKDYLLLLEKGTIGPESWDYVFVDQ